MQTVETKQGFDKYELAKVFNHVTLQHVPPYLTEEQMTAVEGFFCFLVSQNEKYDREKCTFGKEVVGRDDEGRVFISGEYTTILPQSNEILPGHHYDYSVALKQIGDKWTVDAAHFLEMSTVRSLYTNRTSSGKYHVRIQSEFGDKKFEVDSVPSYNWIKEFQSMSLA